MSHLQFNRNRSFYLQTDGWGNASPQDTVVLLDNVIETLYNELALELIIDKTVIVVNAKLKEPYCGCPEIIKLDDCNIIYLNTGDRMWSQYAYQFAHELCHHVIDSDFYERIDQFGWFEESLCELASIFCISEMSKTWLIKPPYPNWIGYSSSLSGYAANIINDAKDRSPGSFPHWLHENIGVLHRDRYRRDDNRIIAFRLFPLFINESGYWRIVQYLKLIEVTNEMGFESFIDIWGEKVPNNLKNYIDKIRSILFN